jgi:hypothetical protein
MVGRIFLHPQTRTGSTSNKKLVLVCINFTKMRPCWSALIFLTSIKIGAITNMMVDTYQQKIFR